MHRQPYIAREAIMVPTIRRALNRGRCVKYKHIYIAKHHGKGQLGSLNCNWKDNINTNLVEMVCEGADWIQLTGRGYISVSDQLRKKKLLVSVRVKGVVLVVVLVVLVVAMIVVLVLAVLL